MDALAYVSSRVSWMLWTRPAVAVRGYLSLWFASWEAVYEPRAMSVRGVQSMLEYET